MSAHFSNSRLVPHPQAGCSVDLSQSGPLSSFGPGLRSTGVAAAGGDYASAHGCVRALGLSSAHFSLLALSSFARCPPLAGSLRTAAGRARSARNGTESVRSLVAVATHLATPREAAGTIRGMAHRTLQLHVSDVELVGKVAALAFHDFVEDVAVARRAIHRLFPMVATDAALRPELEVLVVGALLVRQVAVLAIDTRSHHVGRVAEGAPENRPRLSLDALVTLEAG